MKMRKISGKTIYKGKHFHVKQDTILLPSGKQHKYDFISKGNYVGVVALYGRKIIIIKQYRYAIKKTVWEIPLGLIDKGESSEKAALRELEEESGYRAKKLKKLLSFYPT